MFIVVPCLLLTRLLAGLLACLPASLIDHPAKSQRCTVRERLIHWKMSRAPRMLSYAVISKAGLLYKPQNNWGRFTLYGSTVSVGSPLIDYFHPIIDNDASMVDSSVLSCPPPPPFALWTPCGLGLLEGQSHAEAQGQEQGSIPFGVVQSVSAHNIG